MKKNLAVLPVFALGLAALANAQAPAAAPAAAAPAATTQAPPTKVGIINAQACIMSTKEGQKAFSELQAKFQPRKDAIEKKQASIQAMNDQLRKGAATLSAEAKAKLQSDIQSTTTQVNRDTEDASAEWDDAQGKVFQQIGSKLMPLLYKYAGDHGYSMILDVSNQQTSNVLWAATGVEVSQEIVKLYDEQYPAKETSAAPAAAPAGAAAKPAAAKPAAGATKK